MSKRKLLCALLVWGFMSGEIAAQQSHSFAPDKMDNILYGVAYYPEYMPYDRLDKDVDLMQKAGITVVRVGESTWSSWEPRDGEFQFAWMQRVLDRLHKAGIKVILGTPTYSIPTWLYKEHPEILVLHAGTAPTLSDPYSPTYPNALQPGFYGIRQNYDFLNPYFRQHAERVIREIISHFKNHPAVIGYQIDNETAPNGGRANQGSYGNTAEASRSAPPPSGVSLYVVGSSSAGLSYVGTSNADGYIVDVLCLAEDGHRAASRTVVAPHGWRGLPA